MHKVYDTESNRNINNKKGERARNKREEKRKGHGHETERNTLTIFRVFILLASGPVRVTLPVV